MVSPVGKLRLRAYLNPLGLNKGDLARHRGEVWIIDRPVPLYQQPPTMPAVGYWWLRHPCTGEEQHAHIFDFERVREGPQREVQEAEKETD